MRGPLKEIRNAKSQVELENKWVYFQTNFQHAIELITYINNYWMKDERLSKWALYHREV